MGEQEKKDRFKDKRNQEQERTLIGDLAESILLVLNQKNGTDKEPFESYAQELRLRLHADKKIFRERFTQGYETLLATLSTR